MLREQINVVNATFRPIRRGATALLVILWALLVLAFVGFGCYYLVTLLEQKNLKEEYAKKNSRKQKQQEQRQKEPQEEHE